GSDSCPTWPPPALARPALPPPSPPHAPIPRARGSGPFPARWEQIENHRAAAAEMESVLRANALVRAPRCPPAASGIRVSILSQAANQSSRRPAATPNFLPIESQAIRREGSAAVPGESAARVSRVRNRRRRLRVRNRCSPHAAPRNRGRDSFLPAAKETHLRFARVHLDLRDKNGRQQQGGESSKFKCTFQIQRIKYDALSRTAGSKRFRGASANIERLALSRHIANLYFIAVLITARLEHGLYLFPRFIRIRKRVNVQSVVFFAHQKRKLIGVNHFRFQPDRLRSFLLHNDWRSRSQRSGL